MFKRSKNKSSSQARKEALEKSSIIKDGIEGKFWEVLKERLTREIEAGRNAIESPIQTRELGKGGKSVRNDMYWVQYLRGNINALRFILELPDKFISEGDFAREMSAKYKEND